jgi:CRP/FNR family transcriptional regulator, dissimilatory nitrate respiration regulator
MKPICPKTIWRRWTSTGPFSSAEVCSARICLPECGVTALQRAAHLLQLSAAFQGAGQRDVSELVKIAVFASLTRGQVVFGQGEPASSLYIVQSGLLKVSRLSPGGRELTLHLSGPRQLVAGVTAFADGSSYSSSCVAQTDSVVLTLPAEALRQLTYRSPALTQAVLTFFARRHAEVLAQMETLLYSDLNARLAAHLLIHTPPGGCYDLPTNSELAAVLNTVPELVSRKLGEFYRQGFIGLQKRSVQVLNVGALRGLAGQL